MKPVIPEPVIMILDGGIITDVLSPSGHLQQPIVIFDIDVDGADPDELTDTPWGPSFPAAYFYPDGEPTLDQALFVRRLLEAL